MIQCSMCMIRFHNECMGIKDEDVLTSFACPSCRLTPDRIMKLLSDITEIKSQLIEIKAQNTESKDVLTQIKQECANLRQENKELREKVSTLSKTVNENTLPTMVIGDSIIKEFDEGKMENTIVKVHSGIKVKELKTHIESVKSCQGIVICAGTNDCSSSDFDGAEVTTQYKELVNLAMTKVNDPDRIIISSVPPRTDLKEYQENVEQLNAGLCVIARDTGTTFVNNDETFKLSNGTPNDGYLLADGLHLSNKGSNRLARNLKLISDPKINVCKKHKTKKPSRNFETDRSDHDAPSQQKHEDWQTVRRRRPRHPRAQWVNNAATSNQQYCWYCGESNHVTDSCRHGRRIVCNLCGQQGHKAKFCET